MEHPASRTQDRLQRRPCEGCGRLNSAYVTTCMACSTPMRRSARPVAPLLRAPETVESGPNPWFIVGMGAILAPALALLPVLQYVGWFLASLVHEIGHCVVAWTFGAPAYPAIRLDGHAAAIHAEQKIWLVGIVWLILAFAAWQLRHRPRLRIVMIAALVLHPLLAFTESHEVLHLLAGHLAEMAFAGLAFHRAYSGGFTESTAERVLYATVAWYLLSKNVIMNAGLMLSESARQSYLGNGSFGLEQDFLRAARELSWNLSSVGALMFVVSLAVIPAVWLVYRLARTPLRD